MIKIVKYISLLAVVFFGSSCEDILKETPKGALTGTEVLKGIEGLEAALTGAYKPLGITWGTGFATAATVAVLMGSDDLTTHSASNKQDFRELDQFKVTALNARLSPIWSGCYKSIQGANNVINNYQTATGDKTKINQIAGEAFFLRAFTNYWLVRLWGSIPLITTAEFSDEILKVKASSPTEVYKLIEADLKMAETLMADRRRDPGRASKGAAKALLVDVYLTQGGWPIKDASKYTAAANLAKELITNKATYGFDLVPDLAALYTSTQAGTVNAESVFSLHFCGSCQWFTANALYGSSAMPSDEGGWDDYFPEIKFYENFPAGIRKDLTFHTTFNKAGGVQIPWQEGQTKHPYYKKFRYNNGQNTSSTNASITFIKYAHLLLSYAEAQARTGEINADAYAALNAIRKRAGLKEVAGLSKDEFLKAVIDERSWEFAGEYTRWFDLQRLEMVEEVNKGKNAQDLSPSSPLNKSIYYLPKPGKDFTINPGI